MNRTITIKNKLEELSKLAAQVESIGEECEWSMAQVMNLDLVMEEAVSNVINYAFADGQEHDIIINIIIEGDTLSIRIEDDGIPFDPTQSAAPDIDLSVEDRPIGGLGIFLINQIMNSVKYTRENDKNVFVMTKVMEAS